jgi:hypothetical protein
MKLNKTNLIKNTHFIFDVDGFKLVHVIFSSIKTNQKKAFWIPFNVFEEIKKNRICSLSDFERIAKKSFPEASLDICNPKIKTEMKNALLVLIDPDVLAVKRSLFIKD